MIGLLWAWTCTIEVATQFLILASDITTTICGSDDAWRVMLLRLCKWFLMLFLLFLFKEWNEKQFGKMSISLFPSENLWLKEEKEGRILLNLLSMSIIGPLIFNHCLGVSHSSKSQWAFESSISLASNRDFVIWFAGRECTLRWNLPFSFWIWR